MKPRILHFRLMMKEAITMFDNYDNILNVADVAKSLKIGNTQAYKLVRSGKLPAFKEGRAWKISKQSLTQYVQQNTDL